MLFELFPGCKATVRRHGRARSVRFKVRHPGVVEVVVPPQLQLSQLPAIVARHETWLRTTLQQLESERPVQEPPESIDLPAVGERWPVEYRAGCRRALCRERAGRLYVEYAEGDDWRPPLLRWLQRRAKQLLPVLLETVSTELGLVYRQVSIRGQRTRWGSCSSNGTISLNRNLLFLEPELVDYLLVHELCHTRHLNHSTAYWTLVERYRPDYRPLDRRLRKAARELPGWLAAR